MAIESRPWTRADLARLPDDGNKYEVIDGVLFVTPPPAAAHQNLVALLSALITPFVAANKLGVVHQARSVVVTDASEVEPDLMVLPHIKFSRWEDAPTPTLVIEVLSRSTQRRDLGEKRRFYLEKGVAEYWVVDRFSRGVTRIRPHGEEIVTASFAWTPPNAAISLEIDLGRLFASLPA